MAAILGKKLGMTQIFREDGTVIPVTVVEAGPCKVTAVRDAERDGYSAVQLAFGEVKERKLSKAEVGHLKKAGAAAMRHVVEFRDETLGAEEGPKIGDDVTVTSFEPGQKVKVSGVSIGKGFQGGIKRHNFSRGPSRMAPTTFGLPVRSAQAPSRHASSKGCACQGRWATSASPRRASKSPAWMPSATCS